MKRLAILAACLIFTACASVQTQESADRSITFIHLNDTYRIGAVEDGRAGGFGRVVTVVRSLLSEGRDVRILHGGDFLYPSLESQLWNGLQMIDAFNYMHAIAPLYAVAGNHEFDRRTPEHLAAAVRASKFAWLGDNYAFRTGSADVDSALKTAYTFTAGGRTIGVFSLTLHTDDGGNKRDYAPVDKDYVAIAERVIGDLQAAGVDAIVGLTHLHMWQDEELARLKRRYPKLAFIAGGHEHEPEYSAATAGSAAVVKGASNARIIWRIDLNFDAVDMPFVTPQKIVLGPDVVSDSGYDALERRWRTQLLEKFPFLEARIGVAAVPLDGREVTVRNEESNWGNFIVDQMRGAFGEPEADFAFINSGTLRLDDYVDGDIQFEDIGRTFGFSSFLRLTEMSGAEFRAVLEAGYRGSGPSKGYFPQVSGFRICVDRSRREGDRIVSLQMPDDDGEWSDIDADTVYSVVVPDYLYGGGDGYDIPKQRPASPPASELKYRVLDAIVTLQALGREVGESVDPENPRYFELLESKQPCFE